MGKALYEFDAFSEQIFGRITGTFNVSRFPSVPGRFVKLKANSGNTGSIWIGDVTKTGTFPMPYQLAAGADLEWTPLVKDDTSDDLGNLNSFYMNGASGSCYVSYWIIK